ncbi:MAG: 2-hydroxyacyl-CoA dehydratase family protein, partial [Chloroflexota bacterium]|nr:2-hydroxyacyl-CoA dehydratase family protein [Chloroflexota bacterium]
MKRFEGEPGGHPKTTALKATQMARKASGLIKAYYAKAQEASRKGEPIAWSMVDPGFPSELLYALGVFTIYPEHYATICAAKGANMGFIERAERDGYPLYTCSYARNGLGYAAQMQDLGCVPENAPWGGMPKPAVLMGRTSCDPGLNWFTAFPRYTQAPLFVFDRVTLPVSSDYEDEDVKR